MKNKYCFVEYKSEYIGLFENEKEFLKRLVPKAKLIEHIGSTSVPGLGGKAIVDILLVIDKKEMKTTRNRLLKNSYELMKNASDKNRISLKKTSGIFFKRRYHLHITSPLSKTHKEIMNFKKKLIGSEELRQKYVEIKKEACKIANGDGRIYRELKNRFIGENSK